MRTTGNYGQEVIQNEWQLRLQNFLRLLIVSLISGLALAFVWFALRSPKDSISIVIYYWWSWLYCHIPFGCSESAINNMRLLQPLMVSIAQTFNTCKGVFAFGSVTSGILLQRYFHKQGKKLTKERYLRGAKLLKPQELQVEIEQLAAADERLTESPFDLRIGKSSIRLPVEYTYTHFELVGLSGTGKTQVINKVLEQLRAMSDQKVLILDPNGQFYSRFGKPGDVILSLYDKRSVPWDFWQEDVVPEFFGDSLIEEDPKDKFFGPAGRKLLTALIKRDHTIEEIWTDINGGRQSLTTKLKGLISDSFLAEAEEQGAGIKETASLKLSFLQHLNHWCREGAEPFSLTRWTQNQEANWVFLVFEKKDFSASKHLLRLWFDLCVKGVVSRQEKLRYPHLWLIADELPRLGRLESLGELISEGRKYRGTVMAGYQSPGQIKGVYGQHEAEEIIDGLQTRFFFRHGKYGAEEASKALGKQYIEELGTSIQFGKMPTSDRSTLNRSVQERPVVMPSEIQGLPDLQAYFRMRDLNPTLLEFPYQDYPQLNEPTCSEIPKDPAIAASPTELEDSKPQSDPTPETTNSEPEYDFEPDEDSQKATKVKEPKFNFDDDDDSDDILRF